jgi:sigma-B regulation protein RsbU (phosphoserine phosphatase)
MSATLSVRDHELRVAEQKARAAEVQLAVTRAHMEIAKQIQRSLVPQLPLAMSGMKVAGRCIPADAVGGDYFGYFPREAGGIDSFVGDVSGHGVGAALLMAEARIMFLTERLVEPGAAKILAKLNDLLHEDLDQAGHFMTACCATFDAERRQLKYANAGHPPALLLRAGQPCCATLEAEGMLLGLDTQVEFGELEVSLDEGDIVVFYTDGVTETKNAAGDQFGRARLEEVVVEHRALDPDVALDEILAELGRFAGTAPREDDVTIVLMKLSE